MIGQEQPRTYTVKTAAARVERSVRTVEKWIADGDLEVIEIKNRQGKVTRRHIREDLLLTVLREKLTAPRGGKGKQRPRNPK